MDYTDKDFERLSLKVHPHHKDADVFRLFPILSKYDTFLRPVGQVNINYVIRYVAYCYDKNSPLQEIEDLFERRVTAAKLAGFQEDDRERFDQDVTSMLLSRNEAVNDMIIQYSIIYGGADWSTLMVFEESLRTELEKLNKGSADDKTKNTGDVIKNVNSLRQEIRSLRDGLFAFRDDPWLEESLYRFMQYKNLKLVPEDYARYHEGFEELIDVRPQYVAQQQDETSPA